MVALKTRCKKGRTSAKFVPRSRVGSFHNECTRSTPLDPKLMFWCISYYLGRKRAELVQKFVPRTCVEIFRNERTRSTPLDPKLMFSCISYYLYAFGTIWLSYETRCKTVRTSAEVRARSRVRIFGNQRIQSTPLDPELMFWCVLYIYGAFGTVWLSYETRCKTGRTGAKVRATKSLRNFSQRSHPIHPIGP